jgi:hypothetical protein
VPCDGEPTVHFNPLRIKAQRHHKTLSRMLDIRRGKKNPSQITQITQCGLGGNQYRAGSVA